MAHIFINNVDGYLGNAVCTDLKSYLPDSHIIGTLKGGFEGQVPPTVRSEGNEY
jgi:hypothetical protein